MSSECESHDSCDLEHNELSSDSEGDLNHNHGHNHHHSRRHAAQLNILNYDQIMKRTINKKRYCCKQAYQNMGFLFITFGIACCNPIMLGISYLLVEPTEFRCLNEATKTWSSCSKTKVCVKLGGNNQLFYADSNAPNFIYNWV